MRSAGAESSADCKLLHVGFLMPWFCYEDEPGFASKWKWGDCKFLDYVNQTRAISWCGYVYDLQFHAMACIQATFKNPRSI
jgi:hypothetical protein